MGRCLVWVWMGVALACSADVDPEEVLTRRTVGLAYLEENRLEEAEAEFIRLIEIAPDEPLGYANLGVTYLRLARYDEAERRVRDALRLESDDPDVRLILATILGHAGRIDDQRAELEQVVAAHPDHVKSLYTLSEWFRDSDVDDRDRRREELLGSVVGLVPSNLPSRLQLIDLLLARGLTDSAAVHAEEVQRQIPELPLEAAGPFADGIAAMQTGDAAAAARLMRVAHNALRVTQLYSAGVLDVVGPGGPSVGFPVLTFSRDISQRVEDADAVFLTMRFADATASAGLSDIAGLAGTTIAGADVDGDGDADLLVGTPAGARFLHNEFGRFVDVSNRIESPDDAIAVTAFADVDNNGWLDLLAAGADGIYVFSGREDGVERVASARLGSGSGPAVSIAAIDFDQDGDLDLVGGGPAGTSAWRNNLDGTFADRSEATGLGGTPAARHQLGDLDDDGDVDLIAVRGSTIVVFDNRRGGRFEPIPLDAVPLRGPVRDVVVGDVDNDGWLDLFVLGDGDARLLGNTHDGRFVDTPIPAVTAAIAHLDGRRAALGDLDNDGRLDVIIGGTTRTDGPPLVILRNTPAGFTERLDVPATPAAIHDLVLVDYNEDGDLDVATNGPDGVRLLRNDGGNGNRYLRIALVGLRAGNGKNNHFGIGAKVEVRAGDLYQTRVVTSAETHFGLGQRIKADAVRIQWTNGVPQNLFYPGSDQDVVEEQTLKGSCAFLYTWNGTEFTFVTDVVWRSALGMPLGIMGGASTYAPAFASQEYVKIPRDALRARNGRFEMQITEELWEAAYLDEVSLLAIDHPDSVDVFVDERFRPPVPNGEPDLVIAGRRFAVHRAVDDRGNDVTSRIAAPDFVHVDNLEAGPYQGITAHHDLILDLGPHAANRDDIILFLRGWIFPSDASINVAVSQSNAVAALPPILQVRDTSGRWVTVDGQLSFPSGKNKLVVADLSGLFRSADRSVRIRTNLEIYWDHVFFALGRATVDVRRHVRPVVTADLHFRGFSAMYRRGGRFGPHWFDYDRVTTDDPWGPVMEGDYTRYGDVQPLLAASDDMYVIMQAGDEVTVTFDAALPALPAGWTRDYLLYTDGWIKDADLNTATGNRVGPLPFHAADGYPYPDAAYPTDDGLRRYQREYNTRRVTRR